MMMKGKSRKVTRWERALIFPLLAINPFFMLLNLSISQAQNLEIREIDNRLIEAVRNGNFKETQSLIGKGGNINARTEFGETPLHLSVSKEMAKLLISKGANVNAKDYEFQMTPLFNASKEVSELLISNGADVNVRGKKGITALAWAVYWNNIEKIRLLISKEADLNAGDEDLKTPLHIAANWNKTEIAALLISKGANVNARDDAGWTPLHWASFEGGPEVIRLLISKGAETNVKTNKPWAMFPAGSSPVDIAEQAKLYDLAAFLKSKGGKRGKDVR